DNEILIHRCALNALMGSKVVTVRLLVSGHGRLVATEQALQLLAIGKTVRAVGENDDAVPVLAEEPVKCLYGGPAVAEGRVRLLDFFDFRLLHDGAVFPVTGKPLQEVIALHVAVIVRARYVGRIQINEIDSARAEAENVGVLYRLPASVVKHHPVKGLDLFEKMLFDGEPQIPATI